MYETLRDLLKDRGLSLSKLSYGARISLSDLSSALSGKKPMYPNWRKRICEYLELSEDEVFKEGVSNG